MKAIINVRLGSTRLPGKVLMNICDKPALQHLIERVGKSKYIEDIIINTTTEEIDNKIVDFCKENHYVYNRGSEEDVTSRISSAINNYQIKNFVEIYGDCPLVDYRIIDSAIEYFNANDLDFYGNDLKTTFPPGFEVEVVKSKAFLKSDLLCDDPEIREHGTLFMRLNPDIFKIKNFEYILYNTKIEQGINSALTVTAVPGMPALAKYINDCSKIKPIYWSMTKAANRDDETTGILS